MPDSLWPHGLQPIRLLCPWDFPGKDTGVGCHFLFQGVFPTQGIEPLSPVLADGFFTTEPKGSSVIHVRLFVYVKISFFQRSTCLVLGTAITGWDTEVQLVHRTDAHRRHCASSLAPKVARLPQGLPRWTWLPVHTQERPQSTLMLDSFPGSPQNHSDTWKCFLLLQSQLASCASKHGVEIGNPGLTWTREKDRSEHPQREGLRAQWCCSSDTGL